MAWPHDPLPPIRHELHFGDRLVRCFEERPPSLWAMFAAALAHNPDGIALIDEHQRLTYAELGAEVDGVAAGLAERGIGVGDRVALLIGNRAEFLTVLLAAARLGAITVPLSPREASPGLHLILDQTGAKVLIYQEEWAERLPEPTKLPYLQHRIALGDASLTAARAAPAPHEPGEEDVALILHTSGTTGRPKGAMLTQLNIAHSVIHYALAMDLTARDRSLLAVPATHVTGVVAILLAMVHVGGGTVLLPRFDAKRFLQLAAEHQITHTVLVPAMYHLCLLHPDFARSDLSAWRIGAYGGAPMPVATIDQLTKNLPGLGLMNAYGATETTSPTTLLPSADTAAHADAVGWILPCAEVRILTETGQEAAPGEPGEVWIKGPMVVPGYWANDTATKAAFTAGFWRSGDIGALDADGYLHVFDRLEDMINRAGYKIYSAEVENVLNHHPDVAEAAVVAHPDPVLGEKVHAFVSRKSPELSADVLRDFCAQQLADYKIPDYVTFDDQPLPRNANGKLQKSVLRQRIGS